MTPAQRIAAYEKTTGWEDTLWLHRPSQTILGVWRMGNDYRVKSGYYGGYPAGYLKRIKALFPDKPRALHLFAGRVDLETFPGSTVDCDIDLDPDFVDDAETLTDTPVADFDLVLADPPYSVEDAVHYGSPMVNRNKVMKALTQLKPGAHVVWLDQVRPMYSKKDWSVVADIGMVKSTNHRYRVVTIFERTGDDDL